MNRRKRRIRVLKTILYIVATIGLLDMAIQAWTDGDIELIQGTLRLLFGTR